MARGEEAPAEGSAAQAGGLSRVLGSLREEQTGIELASPRELVDYASTIVVPFGDDAQAA